MRSFNPCSIVQRLSQPYRLMIRSCVASTIALGLTACAIGDMATIAPDTPLDTIIQAYGTPSQTCTTETGQQRVLWTQQPMGQYAWATNVTPDGRAERVELVLSDTYFERLREGVWTPERVLCTFGPPAKKETIGLPSLTQYVWSYRYRENSTWNSLMYVNFGTDGKHVVRFGPGPDPLYARDGFWLD